jgi:hypothetical protein
MATVVILKMTVMVLIFGMMMTVFIQDGGNGGDNSCNLQEDGDGIDLRDDIGMYSGRQQRLQSPRRR